MNGQLYVEPPKPEHGAAYRVIYEQFNPQFMLTRERQAQILGEFAIIRDWLTSQDKKVEKAYEWAMQDLAKRMEIQLKANELGNKVNKAFAEIGRPPNCPAPVFPTPAAQEPTQEASDAEAAE